MEKNLIKSYSPQMAWSFDSAKKSLNLLKGN